MCATVSRVGVYVSIGEAPDEETMTKYPMAISKGNLLTRPRGPGQRTDNRPTLAARVGSCNEGRLLGWGLPQAVQLGRLAGYPAAVVQGEALYPLEDGLGVQVGLGDYVGLGAAGQPFVVPV